MWISAAHVPGKDNIEADHQFRILQGATEWKLHPELFQKIVDKFGKPDIDLFASRINRQLKSYVSWHPEPEAMAVNAFSLTWNSKFFYMFPPTLQSCRSSTSKGDQGQDQCSYSGARVVNSILVPSANADDHPRATMFSTITKKSDAYTQTL